MIRDWLGLSTHDDRPDHRAVDVDLAIDDNVDSVLDTLSNPRRREVIHRVADLQASERGTQPTIDISDLAEYIASVEDGGEGIDDAGWNQRQRVYVSLYQTHLPKLAERDAITYDERAGVIGPSDDTAALSTLLSMVESACQDTGVDSQP